ncbi:hypothetical protein AGLY_012299 [Aphis glycines]|uniref:Uncharacterized protein n=1 Tax=Aphis glycines TaxID=307491 RepID=A0A6G0TBW4_APHGL|nr:hypothetical protein AGLY_012299 [Aphis glycines]
MNQSITRLVYAYNSAKRSGKPFPESFRMSRDRTTLQRKLLRTCYEDLERRVKSGETGLRVVIVNGFPTVSALSKNGNGRFFTNIEDACLFLSSFDWYSTFQLHNVDGAFNTYYDALHKSVLDFVPKCTFTDSKFPPWFDKGLKNILYLKKKGRIKFKASSSAYDYREFSLLRARFKYESKKCLRNYVERIESSLISNPAGYWKFVRNKKSFSMIPKVVSYSESTSANEQDAANLFSLYFSSVFSVNDFDLDTTSLGIKSFGLPNNVNFTVDDVYKKLSNLHGNYYCIEYLYQYIMEEIKRRFMYSEEDLERKMGPKTYLSKEEEMIIKNWILAKAVVGFPIRPDDVKDFVQNVANGPEKECTTVLCSFSAD